VVVNTHFAYNLLLGKPSLKRLGAVASTKHIKMKLSSLEGREITIRSNQKDAQKCYESSYNVATISQGGKVSGILEIELSHQPRPGPVGDVQEREIKGRLFKLGTSMGKELQHEIARMIARHLHVLAWTSADMPGIDPDFLCHKLIMDNRVRPVVQRRRKFNDEKRLNIKIESQKLLNVGHIRKIQYPEWLANMVLVQKTNEKWRMCVDFTDLNKACPKDSYPLPSIGSLVDSASGCRLLSFLDAFSRYN